MQAGVEHGLGEGGFVQGVQRMFVLGRRHLKWNPRLELANVVGAHADALDGVEDGAVVVDEVDVAVFAHELKEQGEGGFFADFVAAAQVEGNHAFPVHLVDGFDDRALNMFAHHHAKLRRRQRAFKGLLGQRDARTLRIDGGEAFVVVSASAHRHGHGGGTGLCDLIDAAAGKLAGKVLRQSAHRDSV